MLSMSNLTSSSNMTTETDITTTSCFSDPIDSIACARYSTMAVITILTAFMCIGKIIRLHIVMHQAKHHYFIFYFSTLSCILCGVHWILGKYPTLDFLAQWFKQLSCLTVTHFFWVRAHRALRREILTNYCLLPFLIIGFFYCTTMVIIGSVTSSSDSSKSTCTVIFWLLMSSAELLIAQMFFVAAMFILRRLDQISTLHSERIKQKLKLWSLVAAFELSAVTGFSYDLTMRILGSRAAGLSCGDIFHGDKVLYSVVFGCFMIIKFAVPVWVLLAVLEPIGYVQNDSDDDDVYSHSSVQSSGSGRVVRPSRMFRPRLFRPSRSREGFLSSVSSGHLATVSEESSSSLGSSTGELISRPNSGDSAVN